MPSPLTTPTGPLFDARPAAQGMYDPQAEHDACGLAVVADISGRAEHRIVQTALGALRNLEHRGAVGSDAGTGDGAGILTQIPDALFRARVDFALPAAGYYAAGCVFLPAEESERASARAGLEDLIRAEGLELLGWRVVPVRPEVLGAQARAIAPRIEQLFVQGQGSTGRGELLGGLDLDRRVYRLRKRAEHTLGAYFVSLSSRTIGYKGMVTTLQLAPFFPDLDDALFRSALAIVHSRYSTNTFPSWPLAQPLRMVAHNGEINTVTGNRNWMAARQSELSAEVLGDVGELLPIITPGGSDSASFDEVCELLVLAGRSLPHAMLMMVPEAYERRDDLDPALRAFYDRNALAMEPWDGPAALAFTDGTLVGATLDRNGLRPGRWVLTNDGLVVLGSETGTVPLPAERVVHRGRLRPGEMFLIDTAAGRIIPDAEIKSDLASAAPWEAWRDASRIELSSLPEREHVLHTPSSIVRRQRAFGYTEEELRILLAPMARTAREPLGAMGSDTPIAALSERPRLLFDYFAQRFAQVTNPPLDAIREESVTSLRTVLGPESNILASGPAERAKIVLEFPVIDNDELAKIQHLGEDDERVRTVTLRALYRFDAGPTALAERLEALGTEARAAVASGAEYLVVSDRDMTKDLAPIPSLLALSAVHRSLMTAKLRMRVGLVVEAGDVREVHHVAVLLGYGASAINPYLAMESVEALARDGRLGEVRPAEAVRHLIRGLGSGVLKIMSKMGISTVSGYSGAQTFEAVGLDADFVADFFPGTASRIGGIGLPVLAADAEARHREAYPENPSENAHRTLSTGGEYQWRREGPPHLFDPETVFRLQHATRSRRFDVFRAYSRRVNEQDERALTLRGLFRFADTGRAPVPLEEVEPAAEILRRFSTGAMSYGSISQEAHETLAIAMNRLGAKSNSGEGGEDPERLADPSRRSAIKQVASARFGVTSAYLASAQDIQIKLAQGAKPGEGGQLPPEKVYPWIARTRHATPAVGLISPPPHHDIYSIEDLKQLIFDLKRANPTARINTKLVSQSGIGAVAAGVAKALSDVILVSGHDGGTGASPLNSLKHAGTPWELGLAEVQQTLMLNGLRDRVTVQVDGQMRTGRDVIIAALLGAEEYGFATAPLVVSGCIMMRVCHLDTCPVGIATQNPVLRERFTGRPEFVETFFEFLAEEVRELLAALGARSLDEIIGHTELLDAEAAVHGWKQEGLDLSAVLRPEPVAGPRRRRRAQDHELDSHLDTALIADAAEALAGTNAVRLVRPVLNTDRAVGTMLGYTVTRTRAEGTSAPAAITLELHGSAGQSLGAFLPEGIEIALHGDANDYLGKGLSGGVIAARPPAGSLFRAEENVVAGNVIGYGATSGALYLAGQVGERFLVRNSGATAVVEGVGDHALEYMTGGTVLMLGGIGRNLGAGFSGGTAYVLDLDVRVLNPQALSSGELRVRPLTESEALEVRGLLYAHLDHTDSALAATLIARMDETLTRIQTVVPRDFEAVREVLRTAERTGMDVDGGAVWTQMLEATRG